jgi:hypothetical protein
VIRRRRCQKSPIAEESTKETDKTVAQGMPVAGFTCSDFARVFLSFAREAMGCGLRNPAFPAPSVFTGGRFVHNSGVLRRETTEPWLFDPFTSSRTSEHRERDPGPDLVMAGLDPAIHVLIPSKQSGGRKAGISIKATNGTNSRSASSR